MYTDTVMDHFLHPRNVGEMKDASAVGEAGNARCGDSMRIFLKVDDQERITDVRFKTFGCATAIASSSMATTLIKGKTIEQALTVTNRKVAEALGGLPPVKLYCSVLAEQALCAAVKDYRRKHGLEKE